MKSIKKYLPILISVITIASTCTWAHTREVNTPVVTLFIHGSKPPIHDIFYKIGQYFFLPDMHHVSEQHSYAGPRAIISGLTDSEYVDPQHLYFFGWSGRICVKERKEIAINRLLPQFKKLIAQYRKEYHTTPKVHIITHSHGGNVALNLIHELELEESDIIVDELIILAAPVQSYTKEYISSKNCKKLYNIYSANDWIQIADPQGMQIHINKNNVKEKPINFESSKRTFDHHEDLTQVQIVINHRDPGHTYFIDLLYPPQIRSLFPHQFPRFLPDLGGIMQEIKDAKVQAHIQKTKQPIKLKINTHKSSEDRLSVYLQD